MNICQNLPKKYEACACDLLIHALGEKFLPILGEKYKAKRLLELSVQNDYCFFAATETELLGILAFQIGQTNFLSISLRNMISVYGLFTGIFKAIGLSMLAHEPDPDEIYVEAVAVSESARGKKIGSQLFESLFQFAKEKSYKTITLQVIDTNPDAKKLYERLGFLVVGSSKIWPVNQIIGWSFKEVLFMKKKIN